MTHKRWLALLLALVLAVTAMSVTAFAANDDETELETAAADSAEKAERGNHGSKAASGKPEDADAEGRVSKGCGHGKHGSKHKIAEPENAVGRDAAKEAALSDAGLTAEQTEKVRTKLSLAEDGSVIYKVRFTFDGQRYSYRIAAETGQILDRQEAAVEEGASEHRGRRKGRHRQAEDAGEADGASEGEQGSRETKQT